MDDKLKKAQESLLGRSFIQKGSKFNNFVTHVSLHPTDSTQILITYKTLNNNSHTTPSMEYEQFKVVILFNLLIVSHSNHPRRIFSYKYVKSCY